MSWKMMTAIVGQLAHDTVPENFLKNFINVFLQIIIITVRKTNSRPLSSTRPLSKIRIDPSSIDVRTVYCASTQKNTGEPKFNFMAECAFTKSRLVLSNMILILTFLVFLHVQRCKYNILMSTVNELFLKELPMLSTYSQITRKVQI